MKGVLYLVATPIGNLEDITLRAIKVLKDVDIIAAEDTRHTLKLLNHFDIKKKLISYYKQNEKMKADFLIEQIKEGKNIALVSDAGTPGICDPGEEIIRLAINENIKIVPIPGACAFINALIVSGISTREFTFLGFLSSIKKEREEKLIEIKNEKRASIFYEAPHRLLKTLQSINDILGEEREIVLARELTKIHEEFIRGKVCDLIEKIDEPKGEYVVIIKGNAKNLEEIKIEELSLGTLEAHYKYYENKNMDKKEIIKKIAKDRKINKNEIYKYFLKGK